jgi:hypothetical protein
MPLKREELLMKLGAARSHAPKVWRLIEIEVAESGASFSYRLNRAKLKKVRREGRYLLRTNLSEQDPVKLWEYYLQLIAVKEAFKNLKGDLAIRPIHHQLEAHIFIAFLAYCLQCHSRLPTESAGAGAYASFRARQVCRRADD